MDNKTDNISATGIQNSKSSDYRRKRINRMKAIIVVIVIVLLILPTILCIVLGIQVSRLQKQMKELVDIHSEYGLSYDAGSVDYAYAAEKPSEDNSNNIGTDPVDDSNQTDKLQPDIVTVLSDLEKPMIQPAEMYTEEETKKSNLDPDQINAVSEQGSDGIYAGKKVYLTFDDGPSIYTDEILDILSDYDVKATFFVVGKTDDDSKDLYKRIVEEGHTLGMHSYSHKYEKIYNSVEDFDKDFTKLWKLLYDTTGYKPSIYRFPGGSDNLVNKNGMDDYIDYLNDNSIVYFDWNVVSGDATGVKYSKNQLIDNVLDGIAVKNTSIVLMHDSQTKETTVESLPGLLDKLIAGSAQLLPLDKDVPPIQMIKANSIK